MSAEPCITHQEVESMSLSLAVVWAFVTASLIEYGRGDMTWLPRLGIQIPLVFSPLGQSSQNPAIRLQGDPSHKERLHIGVPTDSTQWRSYLTTRTNHQLWKWMSLQIISAPSIQVIPTDAKWNRDKLTLPSSATSNWRIMTNYKPLSFVVVYYVVIDNFKKAISVLFLFYPWGNWGKARPCKLPKVTQHGSRIGTSCLTPGGESLDTKLYFHLISNW